MKALKIQANKVGKRYALVPSNGTFSVWAECSNYTSHVRGGVAKTWRYCEKNLSIEQAEALFSRKLAGKAKH